MKAQKKVTLFLKEDLDSEREEEIHILGKFLERVFVPFLGAAYKDFSIFCIIG